MEKMKYINKKKLEEYKNSVNALNMVKQSVLENKYKNEIEKLKNLLNAKEVEYASKIKLENISLKQKYSKEINELKSELKSLKD